MFLSLFSLILANKFIQIETIGHGFSLTHGPGIANGNHNYMTKYGIPMNLRSKNIFKIIILICILQSRNVGPIGMDTKKKAKTK